MKFKKKEKLYEEYPNGKNHIYNAQTSNMEMFNLDLDLAQKLILNYQIDETTSEDRKYLHEVRTRVVQGIIYGFHKLHKYTYGNHMCALHKKHTHTQTLFEMNLYGNREEFEES